MFNIDFFTTAAGRSPVKEFIFDQEPKARNKIFEAIEYLKEFGFGLPTNYLRRMAGTSYLWELRVKAQSKNYRIFLADAGSKVIVLLHAIIKKTQKTPIRDIDTAQERFKAYKQGVSV